MRFFPGGGETLENARKQGISYIIVLSTGEIEHETSWANGTEQHCISIAIFTLLKDSPIDSKFSSIVDDSRRHGNETDPEKNFGHKIHETYRVSPHIFLNFESPMTAVLHVFLAFVINVIGA